MGVSRSEALRRGVPGPEDSGYEGVLRELADDGLAEDRREDGKDVTLATYDAGMAEAAGAMGIPLQAL